MNTVYSQQVSESASNTSACLSFFFQITGDKDAENDKAAAELAKAADAARKERLEAKQEADEKDAKEKQVADVGLQPFHGINHLHNSPRNRSNALFLSSVFPAVF